MILKFYLEKKIYIKGSHFDASNLPKFFNQKSKNNILSKVNKEIEIDFKNIVAPLSEKLENFKLIGEINDGRFVKKFRPKEVLEVIIF